MPGFRRPSHIVETIQNQILGLSTSIFKQHSKLFQGLGCLKTPYHIQIDPLVPPVVNLEKPNSTHTRETEKMLDEMEATGVV